MPDEEIPPRPEEKKQAPRASKEAAQEAYAEMAQEERKHLRLPVRAMFKKAAQLRADAQRPEINPLLFYNLMVDMYKESRMCLNRTKLTQTIGKIYNPQKKRWETTFTVDDKLVMEAIKCTSQIIKDLEEMRQGMAAEDTGIPRWAIEKIEQGLKNHPEARLALLESLAAGQEKDAVR
jgi:hypothetical protein